jgi:hypothetical protein
LGKCDIPPWATVCAALDDVLSVSLLPIMMAREESQTCNAKALSLLQPRRLLMKSATGRGIVVATGGSAAMLLSFMCPCIGVTDCCARLARCLYTSLIVVSIYRSH